MSKSMHLAQSLAELPNGVVVLRLFREAGFNNFQSVTFGDEKTYQLHEQVGPDWLEEEVRRIRRHKNG